MEKVKILFVCHGNICRSPMAEFVMKDKLMRAGVGADSVKISDRFEVASAATSTEEIGNPVYPPARRMLHAHGIDCSGKHARQMTVRDYEYYDYIVLMDRNNLRNLRWILPRDTYERESESPRKVSLLMEWAGVSRDVADPWYTGDFQTTWDDVNLGCDAIINKLTARF
ncbi:MAG: low molecular weight phosphotyrosine protein phosphatase [Fibrobacter sp.]|nr:low molecular weight phosphotyrosine protein phosphatase [Fibrobacter sp.]